MITGRYLAIVHRRGSAWNARLSHLERDTGLCTTVSSGRLVILVEDPASMIKIGTSGCIVGTMFRSVGEPNLVSSLSDQERDALQNTRFANISKDYWGAYVGFLSFGEDGALAVRDPMGVAPCYYVEREDYVAFASDAVTLHEAGLVDGSVNWDGVALHLLASDLRTRETGLSDINELYGGASLAVGHGDIVTSEHWSPWGLKIDARRSIQDSAYDLREVVNACTRAWCDRFPRIVLGVSGGLDSSIIGAIGSQHADLHCFTMATRDPFGDERHHARSLTETIGVPLVEAFYDDVIDLTAPLAPHIPRPVGTYALQVVERHVNGLIASTDASAVWSGSGGDNVFFHTFSAGPLVDCLLTQGLGHDFFRTLANLSRVTESSVWAVLGAGLRRATHSSSPIKQDTRLMHPDAVAGVLTRLWHPWLTVPSGQLPGQILHVGMILRAQTNLDYQAGATRAPVVLPLLSQPIVECCLRIPSWYWSHGGRNRGLARLAFSQDLPASIVQRTSKGGPGAFLAQAYHRQHKLIAEMLLDGELASNRLIDRAEVESLLSQHRPPKGTHLRLLQFMMAEAWAARWRGRSARKAA